MCGRFTRNFTWKDVHDFLDVRFPSAAEMAPSFNIAPTHQSPVCRLDPAGARELASLAWGLIPPWSDCGKSGPINARCETVATNRFFREAFKSRRCVIPASGFYEWRQTGDAKQPYYYYLLNDPIFCFAGLWERWVREGSAIDTFTILTTTPNALLGQVHDRMPVILRRSDLSRWLADGDPVLFEPYPAEEMTCHPVSSRVNSPKSNDPSLSQPAPKEGLF